VRCMVADGSLVAAVNSAMHEASERSG
jgi:hypothetical protein